MRQKGDDSTKANLSFIQINELLRDAVPTYSLILKRTPNFLVEKLKPKIRICNTLLQTMFINSQQQLNYQTKHTQLHHHILIKHPPNIGKMTWLRRLGVCRGERANRCVAMATATSAEEPARYCLFLSRFDIISHVLHLENVPNTNFQHGDRNRIRHTHRVEFYFFSCRK